MGSSHVMSYGCVVSDCLFFFSSRRRHTRCLSDWSSDVCSSDLISRKFSLVTFLPSNSSLKQAWAKAVASEEFDGRKVTKENFLEIYGIAHLQSFTLANILASFRKSGIWPLDPTVITAEMMAPSTVESMDIKAITPIDLPSPVK